MKKIGVFKIKTSFNVSVHGIVAIGQFIEGRPAIGANSIVDVDGKPATVKIIGTELGKPDADGNILMGLALSFSDEGLKKIRERDSLKEQEIEIYANEAVLKTPAITRRTSRKINWSQILFHSLAVLCFITSFRFLSYLSDIRLFNIFTSAADSDNIAEIIKEEKITGPEIVNYLSFTTTAWFFGIITAFIVSLFLSIKKGWFWVNSVIAALAPYCLCVYVFTGRMYTPGWHSTIYYNPIPKTVLWFLAIGIVFLALGIFLFFLKRVNRIIDKNS